MTAAQAWREMLAADQRLLRVRRTRAAKSAAFFAANARRAFSEALGVWERR